MRITSNITSDNALINIQNARIRIDRLNEQIASGKNIIRPSDDPITVRNLMDLENIVNQSNQYTSNIEKAGIWLNVTDTALKGMADTVTSIRKIVSNLVGGTDNTSEGQQLRTNAVLQLEELQKQLIDMGNTKLGDQHIFSGFKDDTAPFTTPSTSPSNYFGDSGVKNIAITRNSTIGMNIAGDSVLRGSTNGVSPGIYGGTDILGTLEDLINEIRTPTTQANFQVLAAEFDNSSNQLNGARGDVASKLIRLETTKNLLTRDKNTVLGIISDKQNVDYAKAATEMNQETTAFEAALSVTAKISKMSLLDYI